MYIRFDNHYEIYERKVYSILELIGDIGGLWEGVFILGQLMIGFVSYRMFASEIMKHIYQVRKPFIVNTRGPDYGTNGGGKGNKRV